MSNDAMDINEAADDQTASGAGRVSIAVYEAVKAERKRCAMVALQSFSEPSEEERVGSYEWASRTAANCIAGVIASKIMGKL